MSGCGLEVQTSPQSSCDWESVAASCKSFGVQKSWMDCQHCIDGDICLLLSYDVYWMDSLTPAMLFQQKPL